MDRQVAETVCAMIGEIFAKMSDFVTYSDANSKDESIQYRRKHAIGSCIAEMDLEILEPIYKEYPELRPDILKR